MAGQLIQKGEDSWLLRVYRGRDPLTKKRIYKAVKFEGNQEQARVELDRAGSGAGRRKQGQAL